MFDPTNFLPEEIKKQIADGLFTRLAKLAARIPRASQTFLALKSDAKLQALIDDGLRRATARFVAEYTDVDEDLVAAITQQANFWQAPSVRSALLEIIQNPTDYLEGEQTLLAQTFGDVLQARVNRQRVDKAVTFYLRCVAEALWHLEPFRPVYELQMQRMSVENATRLIETMQGMQTDFRQAVLALVETVGEQQKQLAYASTQVASVQPAVFHNLPQRDYGAFIGREAELAKITEILRPYPDSQLPVIVIDGIGGIGKSTLALEVAHRYLDHNATLPERERFQAIVWTSAKIRTLTADGIQRRPQVHRTLDDLCAAIAITLQRDDLATAQPDQQLALIRRTLTQLRTLLIIDNYETIDDPVVYRFIQELPAPTKALVTTRHRIDVAYAIRLTGMPWRDAHALIAQEAQNRGVQLSVNRMQQLFELTGGVPLALVWSIAQIAYGHPITDVLHRLGEADTDITRFCFDESMARIRGEPAEQLLIALSYFATNASRVALGRIAELNTTDRNNGLVALEKLSLVNKHGDRFSLLPVTRVFAVALAKQNPTTFVTYGKRWLRYLETLYTSAVEYSADYLLRFGYFLSYEDGPNVLDALDWANAYGNSDDVFAMTILADDYLNTAGRWNLMQEQTERAITLARTVRNDRALARSLHTSGWLHTQRGEFDEGERAYAESLALYRVSGDQASVAASLQRYSALHRKRKDFTQARALLDAARQLSQAVGYGDLQALIDTEEGKHQRDRGNWQASWAAFARVRDYFAARTAQAPRDEQLAISVWGHLAIVAYHLGRPQEAKDLCLRSLDFFAQSGTKGFLATLNYRLALAEEALGEIEAARQHVNEALYWFNRLGMQPDIPAALALQQRLAQAPV